MAAALQAATTSTGIAAVTSCFVASDSGRQLLASPSTVSVATVGGLYPSVRCGQGDQSTAKGKRFKGSCGNARISFQEFGLRGEGSLRSLHSLCGISIKERVPASSVQASSAVTEPPAVVAPSKQKIRIKLRSYWVHLIQQACQQILDAAKNTNAQTMGPVPLPTKRRVYCVLRSPHVDKDSREHFEIRTHLRLIDLINPNAQTIDALMQLDLPAGVDVEVKLT